jgi:uncharacterized protein (DUF2141 family)
MEKDSRMPKPLLPVALLIAGVLAAGIVRAGDEPNLRIVATGITSDKGSVIVWVYDKADDWLSDRFRTQKSVVVAGNRTGDAVTIELKLPAGEYAFSVFQDVNDDGKLARSFFGRAREPAGLSNNLRRRFLPERYQDAKFTLGAALLEQKIALK